MEKEYNPIEVSYGVDVDEVVESVDLPIKEVATAVEKEMPKNLIDQIEHMKSHGMTRSPEFKQKMIELENLLGVNQINPFGTNELDIFEDKLKEMTLADMQKVANKVGVNPFLDRPTLKNVLRKEFIAYNRNNRRNIMPSSGGSMQIDPNYPQYKEVQKILGEF